MLHCCRPIVSTLYKVDLDFLLTVPTKKPGLQRGAASDKSSCTEGKRETCRGSSSSLVINFTIIFLEFANND